MVSSPSGAGKTTLVTKALERLEGVQKTISHTTRQPRPGETDGVDYHFVSQQVFESMVKDECFVEYAQVYDHMYGTSKQSIEGILQQGKDAILVIENQGAKEVVKHFDQVALILIKPPSIDALKKRLMTRPGSSSDDIEDRLNKARQELEDMHWYQHVIINNHIDTAVHELVELIDQIRKKR